MSQTRLGWANPDKSLRDEELAASRLATSTECSRRARPSRPVSTDLSDCELFVEGIGHDKISDITTNIIRRRLIEFTKEQCERWGIPTQRSPTWRLAGPDRKHWRSSYDHLPVYLGYPMILVPKRSVRYSMAMDYQKFYDFEVIEFIRENFNCGKPKSPIFPVHAITCRAPSDKEQVRGGIPQTKASVQNNFSI